MAVVVHTVRLIERIRPFTENDPRPLLLAAVVAQARRCGDDAVVAARRRGGCARSRDVVAPRSFAAVTSRLELRLQLPVLIAWCRSAAAAFVRRHRQDRNGRRAQSAGDLLDKFGVHGSFLLST
jgi:hypothetical protein